MASLGSVGGAWSGMFTPIALLGVACLTIQVAHVHANFATKGGMFMPIVPILMSFGCNNWGFPRIRQGKGQASNTRQSAGEGPYSTQNPATALKHATQRLVVCCIQSTTCAQFAQGSAHLAQRNTLGCPECTEGSL
eukprot:1156933-Pelagomonas_calceolata.AAC.4